MRCRDGGAMVATGQWALSLTPGGNLSGNGGFSTRSGESPESFPVVFHAEICGDPMFREKIHHLAVEDARHLGCLARGSPPVAIPLQRQEHAGRRELVLLVQNALELHVGHSGESTSCRCGRYGNLAAPALERWSGSYELGELA